MKAVQSNSTCIWEYLSIIWQSVFWNFVHESWINVALGVNQIVNSISVYKYVNNVPRKENLR